MLVVDAFRIECESIIFVIQVTASRIIGKYHQSDKVLHGTDWISCSNPAEFLHTGGWWGDVSAAGYSGLGERES